MKRFRSFGIGQIVAIGFGLILFLALLIGVGGRVAYDVSRRQREAIQTRGDVERQALQLEILANERTDVLQQYLETGQPSLLADYQAKGEVYDEVFEQLAELLRTPAETEALRAVTRAEAAFNSKGQEALRLYESRFPNAALFLWESEGLAAQEALIQTTENLREVQGEVSAQIIQQARQTERLAIIVVSVFVGLALITGTAASLLITRIITKPLANLIDSTKEIGANLTARVTPSGPHEIAWLGQAINDMAAHLLASQQSLQQYANRLEHELTLASQVQSRFFPEALPQLPGLEIAAFWQPAREIGGDFYTSINLENGKQGIVVGDVSGKGAPAAMAGALAVGLLEAYAPAYADPETLLARLNKDLHTRFLDNYINVACCYLILDTASLRLTVANAGAVYPYLRRNGSLSEVDVVGIPLGMWPEYHYASQLLSLHPGDLLLLSSDGLIEARNEQGELFGFERLQAELMNLPDGISAQEAVNRLVETVKRFTNGTDLHDDLTLLIVRVEQ